MGMNPGMGGMNPQMMSQVMQSPMFQTMMQQMAHELRIVDVVIHANAASSASTDIFSCALHAMIRER